MDNQPQEKPEKSSLFSKLVNKWTLATATTLAGFVGWDRYTGEKTQTVNVQKIQVTPTAIDLGVIKIDLGKQPLLFGDQGEVFLAPVGKLEDRSKNTYVISPIPDGVEVTPPLPQKITTIGHGWTKLPTVTEIKRANPDRAVGGGEMF